MDDIYISNSKNNPKYPSQKPQPGKKQTNRKQKTKNNSIFKFLFILILVVVIIFTGAFGYIYNLMRTTDYDGTGHKENVYVDSKDLMQDKNVVNILFMGVDRRAEERASRSDSMILFSIDKNNHKIKLTSFMRDLWVDIPDQGYAKLNAACTYGGAQLVMDTLECNLKVKIDNYILVDFDTFANIINKLGGINVEITEKEAVYMRDRVHLTKIKSGNSIHLNGNEALWYCRIRYLDSDFMRTYRQRKVMTSIVSSAKSAGLSKQTDIIKSVLPDVETDLNPLDLTKLSIGAAISYIHYDVEQARVPFNGTWNNATKKGQSVLIADIGKNQDLLSEFLYTSDKEKESTTD